MHTVYNVQWCKTNVNKCDLCIFTYELLTHIVTKSLVMCRVYYMFTIFFNLEC